MDWHSANQDFSHIVTMSFGKDIQLHRHQAVSVLFDCIIWCFPGVLSLVCLDLVSISVQVIDCKELFAR